MMLKFIKYSHVHPLKSQNILQSTSRGKSDMRPAPAKVRSETSAFLESIQGDISWGHSSTMWTI